MSSIYVTEPPTRGKVLLITTRGEIELELWSREAPKACRNFIQLCLEGYYNESLFHRIVPDFVAQAGDPTGTGNGGESIYDSSFEDEFHSRLRYNRRGLLGMANNGKNDNGSQFFITLAATPELQNKHTLFGRVVGDTIYNVVKIGEAELQEGTDRPVYPICITSTEVLNNPFDDITPRTTAEELRRQQEEQLRPKVVKKVQKNRKLLSFADEEDESLVLPAKRQKVAPGLVEADKMADLTEKKQPTVPIPTQIATEKVVEPMEVKPTAPKAVEVTPRPKQDAASIQAQIDALKASMRTSNRVQEPEPERAPVSYVEAQRLKYKQKAIIGGRKKQKISEDDMLAKLNSFRKKISTTKDSEETIQDTGPPCELHNVPECKSCQMVEDKIDDVIDDSWLGHRLVFPADKLGKDLSDRERRELEERLEGGLEVIDPRENAGRLRLAAREKARLDAEREGRNKHLR